MWKNCLLQWRHKVQTFIQIIMPILFIANLILLRGLIKPEINYDNTNYKSLDINSIPLRLVIQRELNILWIARIKTNQFSFIWNSNQNHNVPLRFNLLYSPNNNVFENLLNETAKSLGFRGATGINSSAEVERLISEENVFVAVIFDHSEVKKNVFDNVFQLVPIK